MKGEELPDDHHIVRYASPRLVRAGKVDGSAFHLREGEEGFSVNWLECFATLGKVAQLAEVRRLARVELRVGGRYAEANVGAVRRNLRPHLSVLRVVNMPLGRDQEKGLEADPSHSEVQGLPPKDSPEADFVGDLLAECVRLVHPAKLS